MQIPFGKYSFSKKIFIFGIGISFMLMMTYSILIYIYERAQIIESSQKESLALGLTLRPYIDIDSHEKLKQNYKKSDEKSVSFLNDFKKVNQTLQKAHLDNKLNTPIYTLSIKQEFAEKLKQEPNKNHPDALEFILMSGNSKFYKHEYQYKSEMSKAFFEGKVTITPPYEDEHGSWISAYIPLIDSNDRIVAIFEVDKKMNDILVESKSHAYQNFLILFFLFVLSAFIISRVSKSLVKNLEDLTHQAENFSKGDLTTVFQIESNDEVAKLTQVIENARQHLLNNEKELKRTYKLVQSAYEAKSQFLSIVSHELKTPFNHLLGSIELVKDTELSDEQAIMIKMTERSSKRLWKIIDSIIQYTEIEPRKNSKTIQYEVEELLQQLELKYHDVLKEKNVGFIKNIHPSLDLGSQGFPIKQCLDILIENSIEFSDQSEIKVEISQKNENFLVSISDQGPGIEREYHEEIFKPFYQINMSQTRTHEGLGMGLALFHKIVVEHGGTYNLESTIGKGSCFSFTLPHYRQQI